MDTTSNTNSAYTYLDYAASTPLCQAALDAMSPWLVAGAEKDVLLSAGMNANSLHTPGRVAFKALESARHTLSQWIGADRPSNVYFTSGATESDNASIVGIARGAKEKLLALGNNCQCKIITSSIEHDAVLNCVRSLKREGFLVEELGVDRDGFIEVSALQDAFNRANQEGHKIVLVSIQAANSEIGSIQAIKQLCDCTHDNDAIFHTDATQAFCKTDFSVSKLNVDAASFSSHKVYGPRGVGALYLKKATPFAPLILGGGQESGMRSGTQDVCSAVGFAAAAKDSIEQMYDINKRLQLFRDVLYLKLSEFDKIQSTVEVEPHSPDYLPNIVNVMFSGLESDTLVARYDALGFGVSGASACSAGNMHASHVLRALGISKDQALGELRISMGRYTTQEDIDGFLNATHKVIQWKS